MNTQKTFDEMADRYDEILQENLGKGQDLLYYTEYKMKLAKAKISPFPKKILEFGCGTGRNIQYLKKYFSKSEIHGCDISVKSLEEAKKKYPDGIFSTVNDAIHSNQKFDFIFIANVLHHVDLDQRDKVISSISSLLNEDGEMLIIENNPLNPITVKKVKTCPFDEGIILLRMKETVQRLLKAKLKIASKGYCLFFPSQLRSLAGLDGLLKFIPLGAQYYVVVKK